MAHPFQKHNEEDSGKGRAKHLTKEYRRGGRTKHSDEAEDRKLFGKLIKAHDKGEHKAPGKASGGRLDKYARGGRTKDKGHHTKINIVVAPRGPHPADGAAAPALGSPPLGGGPIPPPGPPMAGPPPGLPPRPPIGGPPPGMMKRGGVVKKFAKGGEVKPAPFAAAKMTYGMGSGSGTKQLSHFQKKIRGRD
jgi:hypothetical protein